MRHVKHILEYIILFALNGVMLWFFRGYLNLLIAVFMIVFFLYAFFSVYIVKKYVSLQIHVPAEYMSKNTEFFVTVRLENRCILPLVACRVCLRTGNVFVGEPVENILVLPVKPMGITEVHYPVMSSCVGNVEIMADKLVLEDLLGFHSVSKKVSGTENVYIIPVGGDGEEYALNDYETGMDEVEESKLKGSDFSDVSQVREYIPGDAIKNIHWKLSAKRDNLMVKERLHMSSRKLMVVLALEKGKAEKVDETIEQLFSFGTFFIRNQVPVSLFWWSEKYSEIRQETAQSEEEWLRLMIHLFYQRAGSGFVEEHFRSLYPGKGYILVSGDGIAAVE